MEDRHLENLDSYLRRVDPKEAQEMIRFVQNTKHNAKYANCMSRGGSMQFRGSIPMKVWNEALIKYGPDYWTDDRVNAWLKKHNHFKPGTW